MTHETKKAAKAEMFRGYREKAVSEFSRYTPEGVQVEDTWESVMKALDYVLDHADQPGEKSGAVLTAAMWMHGYLEEDTACRLKRLAEVVDEEVKTALEARTEETAHASTAASAPSSPAAK